MPVHSHPEVVKIRNLLLEHSKGMSITDISEKLNINRNFVAKYLRILLESGDLKLTRDGPAKIYSIANGVPMALLLNMMFDRVLVIDKEGKIVQANASFLSMFSQDQESSIIGLSLQDLPIPELLSFEIGRRLRNLEEKDAVTEFRFTDQANGGVTFEARFVRASLSNRDIGLAIILNDITDSANIERDYRIYKKIVQEMRNAVLITNSNLEQPSPTIIEVNQAASDMTGYHYRELIGKSPRMLQGRRTDRELLRRLKRSLRLGRSFSGQTYNYKKDGEEYIVQWDIHPVRNTDGHITHFVSVQQDVTHEAAENNLITQYEQQQELLMTLAELAQSGATNNELLEHVVQSASQITQSAILIRTLNDAGELNPQYFAHPVEQMTALYEQMKPYLLLHPEANLLQDLRKSQGVVSYGFEMRWKLFREHGFGEDDALERIPWRRVNIFGLYQDNKLFGTLESWHGKSKDSSSQVMEIMKLVAQSLSLALTCGKKP